MNLVFVADDLIVSRSPAQTLQAWWLDNAYEKDPVGAGELSAYIRMPKYIGTPRDTNTTGFTGNPPNSFPPYSSWTEPATQVCRSRLEVPDLHSGDVPLRATTVRMRVFCLLKDNTDLSVG